MQTAPERAWSPLSFRHERDTQTPPPAVWLARVRSHLPARNRASPEQKLLTKPDRVLSSSKPTFFSKSTMRPKSDQMSPERIAPRRNDGRTIDGPHHLRLE